MRTLLSHFVLLFLISASLVSFFLKPQAIHVFFSTNDAYAPHTATAILSLLMNAKPTDKLNIYILESRLSTEHKNKIYALKQKYPAHIEFVHINTEEFKNLGIIRLTQETYYKYIIPRIKNNTKALYLDSDILVLDSLRELWNTDISNTYFAAVKDPKNPGHLNVACYFNAGVLLLNSKKLREEGLIEKMFQKTQELTENKKLWLEDQDVLNILFKDQFKQLDNKFNYPGYKKSEKKIVILHYLVFKPWKQQMEHFDLYWFYRNQTPYSISQEEILKISL